MSATTIITAGTKSYRRHLIELREQAKRFSHELVVFDLGGLGFGAPWKVRTIEEREGFRPRSPFKPFLILSAMMAHPNPHEQQFVWLDGDTQLLKPVPWFGDQYEVGITIHRADGSDRARGYHGHWSLNAGVLFFWYRRQTLLFLFDWHQKIEEVRTGSDQDALVELINPSPDVWRHEARIRLFDAEVFNNRFTVGPQVVIRHFAEGGKTRDL